MDISLKPAERGILLGGTGTGKSTLGTDLVRRFVRDNPTGHVLVLDTKPRYRGQWSPAGLDLDYRGWVKGDTLAESVAWSREMLSLPTIYRHTRVAIFQAMTTRKSPVAGYDVRASDYAQQAFRHAGPDRPVLLFIDELMDMMRGTHIDPRLLRPVRAGREVNMAVLVGSQRPRFVPVSILTEATKYYLFHLDYLEDRKYVLAHLPEYHHNPQGHQFVYLKRNGGLPADELLAKLDYGDDPSETRRPSPVDRAS